MNFFENVTMAYKSIKANKVRSLLTMLGIIIGISSVITILSLGQGGQKAITGEFEKIGAASVNLSVDLSKAQTTDYITAEDIKQLKERIDSVLYVSPTLQNRGIVIAGEKSETAVLLGGTSDYQYINNVEILYGRFFNDKEYSEGSAVGIIDENDAVKLFGYSDVVGESVKVGSGTNNKKMTIIGVSKGFGGVFAGGGKPVFLYIPSTFSNQLFSSDSSVNKIAIMAVEKEKVEEAGNAAKNLLESRHNNRGKEIYTLENALQQLDQINQVLGIFTAFISAVAAISLLVGGIGVMNIMLVSVTERTREIGIRKAVGATTSIILFQFLIESVIISLMGGIIGLILGISGAYLIGSFAGITPSLSITAIAMSILFSSAVGIFFGIYPARKAANLDPIDALRYE